jgi:hypothetical protein
MILCRSRRQYWPAAAVFSFGIPDVVGAAMWLGHLMTLHFDSTDATTSIAMMGDPFY